MRFWQAGLAAIGGMMTVSASTAEASSIIFVAPPRTAESSSFAQVRQIPRPEPRRIAKVSRSPLDAPPDYRWDDPPIVVSASIIALGTREIETPVKAPIPARAQRNRLARAAPATVIRTGVVGSAFPGGTAVATSAAPTAPVTETHHEAAARKQEQPAQQEPAPDPATPPAGPPPAITGDRPRLSAPM